MTSQVNRQITLASRPVGYPRESDFRLVESPVPQPREGELLVKSLWLSLDPYQRGRMRAVTSYAPNVEEGGVITGGVVGRVVQSRSATFAEGDIVEGRVGWQEYATSDGRDLRKLDPSLGPLSWSLGVLGMPGMTAYFGFLDVGQPQPGDTVVVSAASGAVGQVVGQIGKNMGCRVVGIAGTDAKVNYVVGERGFDAGINYKTQDLDAALAEACPLGVDVYFDNVGGPVTDAVMERTNTYARVVICGYIAEYNLVEPAQGPRPYQLMPGRHIRIEGFIVTRFAVHYDRARARLARWLDEGSMKYKEHVVEGIENAPRAFIGMMHGENFGKLLVKVSDE